jgi:hypothetical protein
VPLFFGKEMKKYYKIIIYLESGVNGGYPEIVKIDDEIINKWWKFKEAKDITDPTERQDIMNKSNAEINASVVNPSKIATVIPVCPALILDVTNALILTLLVAYLIE